MRSTAVRRTALAASAAALALLATACGGSDDGDKAKGGDSTKAAADATAPAEATASAPAAGAAKALTAAELEKAALTQADAKSGKITVKLTADDDVSQDKVSVDKPACAPLAYLQAGTFVGKPAASVKRKWEDDPKKPAAGADEEAKMYASLNAVESVITLASYDNGGAEQAMKDLSAAVKNCAGGYSHTENSDSIKVTKVATGEAPKGGDEALAVNLSINFGEGVTGTTKLVVVREGATLVYFPTVNVGAFLTGEDYAFPTAMLDVQLAKLG
ncbi:hypothetical protein [Streptomyces sp. bgisy153]|uniref:hypothetical protein n=1 Tax=Streptomyces sp. bgisy153 TaxID=3413793 RepID=UPI003D730FB4